jgi:uncharacterized phage protein (TIGR01671 family)
MNNREIKFRVWSSIDTGFIYFDIYEYPSGIAGGVSEPMEFTGLKDKNNREIYEGDLINFYVHGAAHGRGRESYCSQEVYYDEESACFMFGKNYTKTGDYWGHCMLDEIDKETIEIVGNIFEGGKK